MATRGERQTEGQLVMVFDLGQGQRRFERITKKPKRRRAPAYTYEQRNQSLEDWWDRNDMSSLIPQAAMTWWQKKGAQTAELSGQRTEFHTHLGQDDDAAISLLAAFCDANFEPITFLGIARKLWEERRRMEDQLRGRGHWLGEFFDDLVDTITDEDRGAKPNITEEHKAKIKAFIRGHALLPN